MSGEMRSTAAILGLAWDRLPVPTAVPDRCAYDAVSGRFAVGEPLLVYGPSAPVPFRYRAQPLVRAGREFMESARPQVTERTTTNLAATYSSIDAVYSQPEQRIMTDPQLFSVIGSVVGVGITLAALIIGLIAWVRSDVKELKAGQDRLENRLVAVEKEQARTSGLLEGLGLTGRVTPDAQPQPASGD